MDPLNWKLTLPPSHAILGSSHYLGTGKGGDGVDWGDSP